MVSFLKRGLLAQMSGSSDIRQLSSFVACIQEGLSDTWKPKMPVNCALFVWQDLDNFKALCTAWKIVAHANALEAEERLNQFFENIDLESNVQGGEFSYNFTSKLYYILGQAAVSSLWSKHATWWNYQCRSLTLLWLKCSNMQKLLLRRQAWRWIIFSIVLLVPMTANHIINFTWHHFNVRSPRQIFVGRPWKLEVVCGQWKQASKNSPNPTQASASTSKTLFAQLCPGLHPATQLGSSYP